MKNLRTIYVGVDKTDEARHENDLYETPPLATYLLHKYAKPPQNIVEPCAGRGNISVELQRLGYDVLSYDLNYHRNQVSPVISGLDVLELIKPEGFDAFITNPPYFKDLPRKIAEKGISEYDYTALFVRLTYLEGIKRRKLFKENPPTSIIFMSDRIRFRPNLEGEAIEKEDQIGGMIAYAWIIWDKNVAHENTKLHWVSLAEEYDEWRQLYDERNSK